MGMSDPDGLYHRAHLEMPPFSNILQPSFFVPFFAYFMCFRFASQFVKTFMWQDYTGFKAYRLQNLSICLLHAMISGIWTTVFLFTHPKEMFGDITHWYKPWAAQLPLISIAYFVHDAVDMLNHEWSRWTLELLVHHIATCSAMLPPILAHKFILANYWALLMEGNSIFLHTRTIMQISGQSVLQPKVFRTVVYCNVITFVLCRFVTQALFVQWAVTHFNRIHIIYASIALGGPVVFCIINAMLFFRVLVSDGFLSQRWRSKAAINRDDEGVVNKFKNGKSE
ncbi:hypothetical protein V3C99_008766 [Haemonchus contortus]|nr:TRAM LAG1 CLN8 homology domain containing protein [Haemonchus contortus]